MNRNEFITYVKGVIDSEMIHNPTEALHPSLRLIKDALDSINYSDDPSEVTIRVPVNNDVPDMVPYHTICSCTKENGGGGICGCVMPNQMVPNPKKYPTTVGTSTTLNLDIKNQFMDIDNIQKADDEITYENYVKTVTKNRVVEEMEYEGDCEYRFVTGTVLEDIGGKYDLYAIPFTKERFMERMKTDEEFAKRWGLK